MQVVGSVYKKQKFALEIRITGIIRKRGAFSKEDMLCKALNIEILDENKLGVQVDHEKVKNIVFHKPSSHYELNQKWYTSYDGYLNKILDLETIKSKGMIGFGMFKSGFDKFQIYIQLCLAISNQAVVLHVNWQKNN